MKHTDEATQDHAPTPSNCDDRSESYGVLTEILPGRHGSSILRAIMPSVATADPKLVPFCDTLDETGVPYAAVAHAFFELCNWWTLYLDDIRRERPECLAQAAVSLAINLRSVHYDPSTDWWVIAPRSQESSPHTNRPNLRLLG